jgi:hypothetical protein
MQRGVRQDAQITELMIVSVYFPHLWMPGA